jgi:hypothetical protein
MGVTRYEADDFEQLFVDLRDRLEATPEAAAIAAVVHIPEKVAPRTTLHMLYLGATFAHAILAAEQLLIWASKQIEAEEPDVDHKQIMLAAQRAIVALGSLRKSKKERT